MAIDYLRRSLGIAVPRSSMQEMMEVFQTGVDVKGAVSDHFGKPGRCLPQLLNRICISSESDLRASA
eukprot:scaffold4740_cov417-Prasinococcus_capsulatus_cf.AAC.1